MKEVSYYNICDHFSFRPIHQKRATMLYIWVIEAEYIVYIVSTLVCLKSVLLAKLALKQLSCMHQKTTARTRDKRTETGTVRNFPLDRVQFVIGCVMGTNSLIIALVITHWKMEIFDRENTN